MQDAPHRDSTPSEVYGNDIDGFDRPQSVPPHLSPDWAWVSPSQFPPDIHLDDFSARADPEQPRAPPAAPLVGTPGEMAAMLADANPSSHPTPQIGQGRRLSEGVGRTLNRSSLQQSSGPATSLQSSQQLRKRARQVFKRHGKLAPLRQQALLIRDDAINATQMVRDQRKLLGDDEDEFMTYLAHVMKTLRLPKAEIANLESLYARVLRQRSIVAEHVEKRIALENELSSLQYQIMERESAFTDSAQRLCKMLVRYELAAMPEARSTPSSGPTTMAVATQTQQPYEPLMADYLGKLSTHRIMSERMDYLMSEHQQDRAQRGLLTDQGETLDVSDDAFELAYDVEYEDALASLQTAQHELEAARNACIDNNIDIANFEQPFYDELALVQEDVVDEDGLALSDTPSTIALPTPVLTPDNMVRLNSDTPTPLNLLLTQQANITHGNVLPERSKTSRKELIQEKIKEWMSGMEGGQAQPSQMAPRSQPVTPLQKPRAMSLESQTVPRFSDLSIPPNDLGQEITVNKTSKIQRRSSAPLLPTL